MIGQNFLIVAPSQVEICTHHEWTRMKIDEGRYKCSEIYGAPRDPQLRQEHEEYLKQRLALFRK